MQARFRRNSRAAVPIAVVALAVRVAYMAIDDGTIFGYRRKIANHRRIRRWIIPVFRGRAPGPGRIRRTVRATPWITVTAVVRIAARHRKGITVMAGFERGSVCASGRIPADNIRIASTSIRHTASRSAGIRCVCVPRRIP
jgi:hypothetical protein